MSENPYIKSLQRSGSSSPRDVSLFFTVFFLVAVALLGTFSSVHAATGLSITLITWNVIGLDSNKPGPPDNEGPNQFPVAVRVCNTDNAAPATNVQTTFTWDGTHTYIGLDGTPTKTLGTLAIAGTAGDCVDVYYSVTITRDTAAWFTSGPYHITATSTETPGGVQTIAGNQLYIEKLVGQNRNGTHSISGPTNVVIGATYTYTVSAFTATNGYESWESYLNFPASAFQIVSTQVTYPKPSSTTIQQLWINACGWIEASRTCTNNSVTAGGDPDTVVYTIKVIGGPGTYTMNNNVYDFSGSSYHYNNDFATKSITVTVTVPTAEEFGSLDANWNKKTKKVDLVWNSLSESQIVGYNVLRKDGMTRWARINSAPIQAKNPGMLFGARYKYKDAAVTPGKKFKYRIEILYADGAKRISDVTKVKIPIE